MAEPSSKRAVVVAIAGNLAIAATKFVAAAFTGSSAMISEGIHSVVDTGNGVLLLYGMRRAARLPDENHAFGHGKELYFWSFVVAIIIFAGGGGMSIYEGILHMRHPSPLENPALNYVVLAVAAVFEAASFTVAWREFRQTRGGRGVWTTIHASKDPSLFTVVFEDSAALAGLAVAFLGVFLSHVLDAPRLDGAASVVIGSILCTVAVVLARESRGLLVGESADPSTVADIRDLSLADPDVVDVLRVLTMHLGPNDVLLNLKVEFAPGLTAPEVAAAVDRVEAAIRGGHPEVGRIYVEAGSTTGTIAPPEAP